MPQTREKARDGKNHDKPGKYQLTTTYSDSVIDPGDKFIIEVYITGYGKIGSAKLLSFPSANLFDADKSFIKHSFGKDEEGLFWGNLESKVTDKATISFQGVQLPNWDEETSFFDVSESDPPVLSTESNIRSAPVLYSYKTKDDIKPGNYSIDFKFTYFNGKEWESSEHVFEFKVRNFVERHENWMQLIVVLITIFGVVSIIESLIYLFKLIN